MAIVSSANGSESRSSFINSVRFPRCDPRTDSKSIFTPSALRSRTALAMSAMQRVRLASDFSRASVAAPPKHVTVRCVFRLRSLAHATVGVERQPARPVNAPLPVSTSTENQATWVRSEWSADCRAAVSVHEGIHPYTTEKGGVKGALSVASGGVLPVSRRTSMRSAASRACGDGSANGCCACAANSIIIREIPVDNARTIWQNYSYVEKIVLAKASCDPIFASCRAGRSHTAWYRGLCNPMFEAGTDH